MHIAGILAPHLIGGNRQHSAMKYSQASLQKSVPQLSTIKHLSYVYIIEVLSSQGQYRFQRKYVYGYPVLHQYVDERKHVQMSLILPNRSTGPCLGQPIIQIKF